MPPSPWSSRLGWCAFLLVGAFVVTSGFEVPASTSDRGATREVRPSSDAPPATRGLTAPALGTEAAPPREMTGPDPVALNQMSMRELEDRIRDLEARLAERQTGQEKKKEVTASTAPRVGTRGSNAAEPAESEKEARSARDEEIERETEERATKMVSDIRDQLKQLEGERARQMEEMLEAAH